MFGIRLKSLRKARRWTLEQMGQHTGLNLSTIHRIEKGQIEPKLSTLKALAKGLGMTVGELVDERPKE